MTASGKAWMHIGLAALVYLAILGATGELHRSSDAFVFFSALWSVQAAGELWRAWRRTRSAS